MDALRILLEKRAFLRRLVNEYRDKQRTLLNSAESKDKNLFDLFSSRDALLRRTLDSKELANGDEALIGIRILYKLVYQNQEPCREIAQSWKSSYRYSRMTPLRKIKC
jgi:hypothetical protein